MTSRSPIPERLRHADWNDLAPRLLLVAARFHRRFLASYPGAPEPADLVQDGIADLLTGKRKLPDNLPLFIVLHEIIRSKVSNYSVMQHVPGQSVRRSVGLDDDVLEPVDGRLEPYTPDPAFWHAVRVAVRDDPILEKMIDCLSADPDLKAADLAAMMEVDVAAIYKANRRLKRRLASLRDYVNKSLDKNPR